MKKTKVGSDILKKNLENLMIAIGIEKGEDSPIRIMNASFANLDNFPNLGIYTQSIDVLMHEYSIPIDTSKKYKLYLEQSASFYLKLYPLHLRSLAYVEHMARLKRMAKYSTLLKNEILKADHTFIEFLDLANHFEEKEEGEPTVYEFFNEVGGKLNILEQLEDGVKNSFFGKSLGIGRPSKKKNFALYGWVALHYNFWTEILNRTMQRDKSGLGGRKRFLEYLDQLMAPLHPEMCSHNIDLSEVRENPITNDAMDSVLKVIQKEVKLRGKNDS